MVVIAHTPDRRAVVPHHPVATRRGLLGTFRQDIPLDTPQSPHLPPHRHFGLAVRCQNGWGQVSQKVVLTVPMRNVGKPLGQARDERLLLVADPPPHRHSQPLGPRPRLFQPPAHFLGGARQQRFGEPDAPQAQLPHPLAGLVALLRRQTVARQEQILPASIRVGPRRRILRPGRDPRLIPSDIPLNRIVRDHHLVTVPQLGPNLGHRPMAGQAPMADPGEHVPADRPPTAWSGSALGWG